MVKMSTPMRVSLALAEHGAANAGYGQLPWNGRHRAHAHADVPIFRQARHDQRWHTRRHRSCDRILPQRRLRTGRLHERQLHGQRALPWIGAVRGLSLYGGWVTTINPELQVCPRPDFSLPAPRTSAQSLGSVSDAFDKGVFLAGFHRFFWKLGDKRDKPGYLMVFAGGSTENQKSNEPSDIVNVPGQGIVNTQQAKKPWDVALYLYQEFGHAAGNPDRKTTIMLGGTAGPGNPQFAQFHVFANLETFGLMKSRPHDRMGVAGWGNLLSDNFKKLVSPVIDLRDLWGVEVYYSVQIIPSVHLTADLQFVQNARDIDNIAVIPAVRLVTDF